MPQALWRLQHAIGDSIARFPSTMREDTSNDSTMRSMGLLRAYRFNFAHDSKLHAWCCRSCEAFVSPSLQQLKTRDVMLHQRDTEHGVGRCCQLTRSMLSFRRLLAPTGLLSVLESMQNLSTCCGVVQLVACCELPNAAWPQGSTSFEVQSITVSSCLV